MPIKPKPTTEFVVNSEKERTLFKIMLDDMTRGKVKDFKKIEQNGINFSFLVSAEEDYWKIISIELIEDYFKKLQSDILDGVEILKV